MKLAQTSGHFSAVSHQTLLQLAQERHQVLFFL